MHPENPTTQLLGWDVRKQSKYPRSWDAASSGLGDSSVNSCRLAFHFPCGIPLPRVLVCGGWSLVRNLPKESRSEVWRGAPCPGLGVEGSAVYVPASPPSPAVSVGQAMCPEYTLTRKEKGSTLSKVCRWAASCLFNSSLPTYSKGI